MQSTLSQTSSQPTNENHKHKIVHFVESSLWVWKSAHCVFVRKMAEFVRMDSCISSHSTMLRVAPLNQPWALTTWRTQSKGSVIFENSSTLWYYSDMVWKKKFVSFHWDGHDHGHGHIHNHNGAYMHDQDNSYDHCDGMAMVTVVATSTVITTVHDGYAHSGNHITLKHRLSQRLSSALMC